MMKDRLITLFGGLLALTLVGVLLIGPSEPDHQPFSLPTSTDPGISGLLGLDLWLKQAGVPTVSFRQRYENLLSKQEFSPTGNLLILSLPQHQPARIRERKSLRQWIHQGNSLLILAAGNDAPKWSLFHFPNQMNLDRAIFDPKKFDLLSDLGFQLKPGTPSRSKPSPPPTYLPSEENQTFWDVFETVEPKLRDLHPRGPHPMLKNVQRVAVSDFPEFPPMRLHPDKPHRITFALLQQAETGDSALWQIPIGNGTVWISRYADLFGNVSLRHADNARLIANLIHIALGPEGLVMFDDMHQGLSALYDPEAFFNDARLHHTLWFIFAFWLFYILGRSNRLAPHHVTALLPQSVNFIRATGGWFAQHIRPGLLGKEILENFFKDIRRQYHLPVGNQPIWDVLLEAPRMRVHHVKALQVLADRLPQAHHKDLILLTNLIRHIRHDLS